MKPSFTCEGLLSLMVGMMLVQSDSELEEEEAVRRPYWA